VTLSTGATHQFTCHVTGSQPLTIKWTGPSGDSLPENVVDLGDGVLEITDAKKDIHQGSYTCSVSNDVGSASDKGVVNVEQTITIKTYPSGPRIVYPKGAKVEIKCEAFGDPDPEVEWLIDPGPERGDLPGKPTRIT
jgi:hypothetical protein